ncbi:DNA topoisomerase [seawater metagenome]|uniref:DNA topoisomerase n=1 Tax=seawater metagenome TaxID=1561972 RepID=A0A5E8CMJ0_9ZZZZ
MKLVIVESPGKINKLEKLLGKGYIVKASFGHCRDLDPKSMSIELENNFKPIYSIINGKNQVVKELRNLKKDCDEVILAADEDREGEMIASALADLLSLKNPKRIVFHEITQKAIDKAIKNPTVINYPMVYAQQARRLLDRIVGYKISPVLWKAMQQGSSSAGRVQSVVVKIIVDKEEEIEQSIASPYFKLFGEFTYEKEKIKSSYYKGKKQQQFKNKEEVMKILNSIDKQTVFIIKKTSDRDSTRNPSPPFITSTLQQDASYKLGFSVQRTMSTAQKLYEGGYITYMRTDSTNLSDEAIQGCKDYIVNKWGKEYLQTRDYNKKKAKGAQEAHEAIRPTKLEKRKLKGKNKDDSDQVRLYQLIWKRTIASQMASAKYNIRTVEIDAQKNNKSILPKSEYFNANYQTLIFDGYLIVYNEKEGNDEESQDGDDAFSDLKKGYVLKLYCLTASEEYTRPPTRYNEPSLVKQLEKLGIGRPSTYAASISKILDRNYVEKGNIPGVKKVSQIIKLDSKYKLKEQEKEIVIGKENNKIIPTEMGKKVNSFLVQNFTEIMDIQFTAKMEESLDQVASGELKWNDVLQSFYDRFNPKVEKLLLEYKDTKKTTIHKDDILIGKHPDTKIDIYKSVSKYGPVVKMLEDGKWKYAPIKDDNTLENIELATAINLLRFPIFLGKYKNGKVYLHTGQYGLYLKYAKASIPIRNEELEADDITLESAIELIDRKQENEKKVKVGNLVLTIKKGPYGPYLTYMKGKKRINVKIPDNLPLDKISAEDCETLISKKKSYKKNYS